MMRIHTKAIAIAFGSISSALFFLVTILSLIFGYAEKELFLFCDLMPGYTVSFFGAFIGGVYIFIFTAVFMLLAGFIYNYLFVRL